MPTSNILVYLAAALFVVAIVWINTDRGKNAKWPLVVLVISALCLGAGVVFRLIEDFT